MHQYYSSIGLVLDIMGVLGLFYTGLPIKINLVQGTQKMGESEDNNKQKTFAYISLLFVLFGFGFQLLGSWPTKEFTLSNLKKEVYIKTLEAEVVKLKKEKL